MWERLPRRTQGMVSTEQRIHTEPGCLEASHEGKQMISTVLTGLSQKWGCSKNRRKDYKKCCTWVPSTSPHNSQRICDQQCWLQNESPWILSSSSSAAKQNTVGEKGEESEFDKRSQLNLPFPLLSPLIPSFLIELHALTRTYNNCANFCIGSALSTGLPEKV